MAVVGMNVHLGPMLSTARSHLPLLPVPWPLPGKAVVQYLAMCIEVLKSDARRCAVKVLQNAFCVSPQA